MFCGQYWAIYIEYSVDSIEQHPLNNLWTVLSKAFEYSVQNIEQYPSDILWTILRNASCVLGILRIIHLLWTLLRYIHYIM